MTGTGEAILGAIITEPAEDLPRLAYADWLEEHGDNARAEFVRVQLELARLGDPDPPYCGGHLCGVTADGLARHGDCRPFQLRCRAADLLDRRVALWAPPPFAGRAHAFGAPGEVKFVAGTAVACSLLFRRGFVEEVGLPCDLWVESGPALVRAAPLARVTLSDRRPQHGLDGAGERCWAWGWHSDGFADPHPGCLPSCLWGGREFAGRRYPSRASALADASRMALAWARAAAGLPPLPAAVAPPPPAG